MTGLEDTVNDNYIIYAVKNDSSGVAVSAEERHQRYEALLSTSERLQQQYGSEKITIYWKFEFIPAIAATIRQPEIIELLQKEGYAVEKQGLLRALQPDAKDLGEV